ncbi:MAG: hypothetical protein DHS20C08_10240 [Rhodomicrobium sp.]|nr:MAG: hypothetical protein DHS20C08_10240 [Rhodomicrobium sp.]
MTKFRKIQISDERAQPPYASFLLWLVLFNIILFAFYALVREGYLQKVLEGDRSMISLVIAFVFLAASLHCALYLFRSSGLLLRSAELLDGQRIGGVNDQGNETGVEPDRDGLVDQYVNEMAAATSANAAERRGIDQANYIFEIYVDKLRSPLELGNFVIDVLIRLGLIGTIIGFIMMLQSFVSGPSPTEENIQELLITMSTGMGTALYTTFAGLVASTLLGVQHQLLSRNIEGVIAALIRLSDDGKLALTSATLCGGETRAVSKKTAAEEGLV